MTAEEKKHFLFGITASFLAGLLIWFVQSETKKEPVTEEED